MLMRHGGDGEPGRYFLVHADGVDEPVGRVALHTSEYDNLDLAWVELAVHPTYRRRGYGTEAMRRTFDVARAAGRTKVGWFGWVGEQTERVRQGPRVRAQVGRRQPATTPPRARARPGRAAVRRGGAACTRLRAAAHRRADSGGPAAGPRRGHRSHQRRAAGRHRDGGRGVLGGAGPRLRARPARQRLPLLPDRRPAPRLRRAGGPVGRRPSTARTRASATSTTPPSSAATVATGWGSCSRPT